jgi:DNA polymerase III subunit beta
MEFCVSKKDLMKSFNRVSSVAGKNSVMPILTNVLIRASDRLTLCASDLVLSAMTVMGANIVRPGELCVPSKAFGEALKSMPEGDVRVMVSDTHRVKIQGGKRKFELAGQDPADFPAMPLSDKADMQEIPADVLADLISLTSFSMSTDENRAHLNAALLDGDGTNIVMVTTDGHRLSKAEKTAPDVAPLSILIPARGVNELKRFLDGIKADSKGEEEPQSVLVGVDGPNIFFRHAGTTVSVKKVEATFPAWQQVMPQRHEKSVTVSRSILLDTVKALSVVTKDHGSAARITLMPEQGRMHLRSENPDVGSGSDEIECTMEGGKLTIGVAAQYLREALSAAQDEDVGLEFSGELDPIVLKATSATYIVMPVRL